MAQGAKEIQRQIYQRFDQLIARGRKQRALRPGVAKLAPAMLMGLARAMLVRRFFVLEETSCLSHLDTVVDFFFAGAGTGAAVEKPKSQTRSKPAAAARKSSKPQKKRSP
jgi:hypothetical protein